MNSRSILLQLKHFDMCSGTLIPDVMHDLLEGALQHIIKLLLCYLIDEKKYLISTKRLKAWSWGIWRTIALLQFPAVIKH